MGHPRTRPQVQRFFLDYGEGRYTVEEIAAVVELASQQVARAIYTILEQDLLPGLSTVVSGQVWDYHPSGPAKVDRGSNNGRHKASKVLPTEYEQVGLTTGKEIIVRPKGGLELFILKPLEI